MFWKGKKGQIGMILLLIVGIILTGIIGYYVVRAAINALKILIPVALVIVLFYFIIRYVILRPYQRHIRVFREKIGGVSKYFKKEEIPEVCKGLEGEKLEKCKEIFMK